MYLDNDKKLGKGYIHTEMKLQSSPARPFQKWGTTLNVGQRLSVIPAFYTSTTPIDPPLPSTTKYTGEITPSHPRVLINCAMNLSTVQSLMQHNL